jgi:hypothetical protein
MYLNKMLLIAMALSLPVTFLPAKQTNAGSVPRTPPILWDCARYNTCTTMLRERVNIFQGLGKSKPAIDKWQSLPYSSPISAIPQNPQQQ